MLVLGSIGRSSRDASSAHPPLLDVPLGGATQVFDAVSQMKLVAQSALVPHCEPQLPLG
jgi:hypothetical protein